MGAFKRRSLAPLLEQPSFIARMNQFDDSRSPMDFVFDSRPMPFGAERR
jgi:hypothetical protein